MNSKKRLYFIAKAASDKKAKDIIILDMRRPSQICDYFIIASGNSTRQVKAISDNIEEKARRKGITPLSIEGYREGIWVLLDYYDIVVHIFVQETREFYNLERLWGDAERIEYTDTHG